MASAMPPKERMPLSINRKATSSGKVSGRELTSARGVPVASRARSIAVITGVQAPGSQRSARGRSSTTQPSARSPPVIALNTVVIAGMSPQI